MPSVMAAAMKMAEASNSFSPLMLLKRGLESIQSSNGMQKMRINVMELGRFTSSGDRAMEIILHGQGERNAGSRRRRENVTTGDTEVHRDLCVPRCPL